MSKKLARIYHAEIFGKRDKKFDFLEKNDFSTVQWKELKPKAPYYFFVPKDFSLQKDNDKNFSVKDLFKVYSAGIKTKVDSIAIDFDKIILSIRVEEILTNKYPLEDVVQKFNLNPKTTWEYKNVLKAIFNDNCIIDYDYRPFDQRYIYFDNNFLSRSRSKVMNNFLNKNNIGLEVSRVGDYFFISKQISDEHFISDNSFKFPLYLYHEDGTKTANFNQEILEKIKASLSGEVIPEDVLDYIYAVLHSPNYREKYKEFLKIDFPRVPYPKNSEYFWEMIEKGRELRGLHLLESPKLKNFITTFPESGLNKVEKIKYSENKVFINEKQYFGNVPEIAWNFFIGGYQPAQKWLKDRKGRTLSNKDLEHYQKIIIVLTETDRIINSIDF